jgi:hypothetical protein
MNEEMMKAYGAAHRIVEAELTSEDRELLQGIRDSDVVVVQGQYDRVEDVLRLAGIPHRLLAPDALTNARLDPRQVLVVNCPGHVGEQGIARIRAFVKAGGSLFTTDWALKFVLEPAFPGIVAFNGRSTGDEVVRIEVKHTDNPFLAGMFHADADPLWWLEGSSYPIQILDPARVQVLLTSAELAARYGEAPVSVAFKVGEGDVLHMISHYYLQRAELRTWRHRAGWAEYAKEVGLDEVAAAAPADFANLSVGQVEAAHKSLKFMTNVLVEKQRRNRGRPTNKE